MSDITVSRKLELMKQIRTRYQRDRSDLLRREQILYGKTSAAAENGYALFEEETETVSEETMLPVRFMIAASLFLAIVICDKSGHSLLGMSTEKCFQAISADYESSIAVWAHTAFDKDSDEISLENPPAGIRP